MPKTKHSRSRCANGLDLNWTNSGCSTEDVDDVEVQWIEEGKKASVQPFGSPDAGGDLHSIRSASAEDGIDLNQVDTIVCSDIKHLEMVTSVDVHWTENGTKVSKLSFCTSSTDSSTVDDDEGMKSLPVSVKKTRKSRRQRNIENEQILQRNTRVIIGLSFIPLLLASITLASVFVSRSHYSKSNEHRTTADVNAASMELFQIIAPTIAPSMVTVSTTPTRSPVQSVWRN